jgi:hypothetical protein
MFTVEFFSTIAKEWRAHPSLVTLLGSKAEAETFMAEQQAKRPNAKLRIKAYK